MSEFGKRFDGPGGRRTAAREPILLSASLHSFGCTRTIILNDVSRTGAQLRVREPIDCGETVWIKVPPATIFGEVVWAEEDRCGIQFDEPLGDEEFGLLKSLGTLTRIRGLSPEEALAMEDWGTGLAR